MINIPPFPLPPRGSPNDLSGLTPSEQEVYLMELNEWLWGEAGKDAVSRTFFPQLYDPPDVGVRREIKGFCPHPSISLKPDGMR